MSGSDVIKISAALRGEGKFREAIDTVKAQLGTISEDARLNANLEIFYAAKEAGFTDEACEYAKKVLADDPDVPSPKEFLASRGIGT
ncbi:MULTISPECIES: hypothetical protein [unclassified Microcoleus]|uniref:hypothetical protein n=1 Tax=unclassified Microcoleus TaxID=2642155 RepID=UPI002FD2B2B1